MSKTGIGSEKQSGVKPLGGILFPLVVLAVSLAITIVMWLVVDREITERATVHFRNRVDEISRRIVRHLDENERILTGGSALFRVKEDQLTRRDWHHYVSSLKLDATHPGVLGFGFAIWLDPGQRMVNIRRIRAEGFPEYDVRPHGERPAYTPIIWLEPFNEVNRRAFGYDMYSEPVRRAAMDRARDSGRATITAKVTLVQEVDTNKQSGMLMYLPSYRSGMPLDTVSQRRAALRGFVYSPIRMNDFVFGALGKLPPDLDFEIHSGSSPSADKLMFSSRLVEKRSPLSGYGPMFSTTRLIEAHGTLWRFSFNTLPTFDAQFQHNESLEILVGGGLLSLLLSAVVFLQARSRRQTLIIADQLTRQLEAQRKLALHVARTPLAVIEWDDSCRVSAWNRAAEVIFDYPAGEAIGSNASFIAPEHAPEEMDVMLREAFRSNGGTRGVYRNMRKDGVIIECEWYNTPLVDQQGTIIGMASLSQDITERRRMEARLHEVIKHLKLACDAASIGIWDWDFSTGNLEWDERLYDLYDVPPDVRNPKAGLTCFFWRSRLHPDDLERTEARLWRARNNAVSYDDTFRIILSDGGIRHIHSTSLVERDENGEPLRMIGINRDISELKRAEEHLLASRDAANAANKAKSEFLANMSHEIRTPMNGIMGMAQLLRDTELNEQQRDYLETITSSAHTLLSLINDVLDLSKIEAGRIELEAIDFSLRDSINEVVRPQVYLVRRKGLDITLHVPAETPDSLKGDQFRLKQILTNLLSNAIKFTDEGSISVSVDTLERREDRACLKIAVTDTGIGVSPEAMKRIFEPFSQADSSITRKYGGTGLGLAICIRLAELMGGRLCAESRVGAGSTFCLEIPFAVNEVREALRGQSLARIEEYGDRTATLAVSEDAPEADAIGRDHEASGGAPLSVDRERLIPLLGEIESLLRSNNMAVMERVYELSGVAPDCAPVRAFKRHVKECDFRRALKCLGELYGELRLPRKEGESYG